MSPTVYLVEGEYVIAHEVVIAKYERALKRAQREATRARKSLARDVRAWTIRSRQVEGVSYGVPVILHNGRKPTARRNR